MRFDLFGIADRLSAWMHGSGLSLILAAMEPLKRLQKTPRELLNYILILMWFKWSRYNCSWSSGNKKTQEHEYWVRHSRHTPLHPEWNPVTSHPTDKFEHSCFRYFLKYWRFNLIHIKQSNRDVCYGVSHSDWLGIVSSAVFRGHP